ncbi:MAG TPA: class I SAM-dependent methyltransferase [Chloroflexota bacterium]|nr:class I SAM-dependent methyltransferase [Chloroflexota bacterium]
MTGLDAKQLYLERARRDVAALGVTVEYVTGDIRALPAEWEGRFDAVVNWFQSFGYFDDATDRLLLREWRRVLRAGRRLVIEHANLGSVIRRTPLGAAGYYGPVVQVGEDLMLFQQRSDSVSGRHHMERVVARGGRVERHPYSIRYFSFPELRDWLLDAGFSRVDACGGDGGPLTLESASMIAVAHA